LDGTLQLVDIGLTVVTTLVIAAALFYTVSTFRNTKKIDQLNQTQNILDKLDNLNKELPEINMDTEEGNDQLRIWEERLFNTLEWLGYLINNELIKDKKIHSYLRDDVIRWYEQAFLTSKKKGSSSLSLTVQNNLIE
jgi:hypothetical protein